MAAKPGKRQKEVPGICGSKRKCKAICDEPASPDDSMKEFSCEK